LQNTLKNCENTPKAGELRITCPGLLKKKLTVYVEAQYASSSLFAKVGRTNAALCICSTMKISQGKGIFMEAISHKGCS
jgi:hypothetical protein